MIRHFTCNKDIAKISSKVTPEGVKAKRISQKNIELKRSIWEEIPTVYVSLFLTQHPLGKKKLDVNFNFCMIGFYP